MGETERLDPDRLARALSADHAARGQNAEWDDLPVAAREVYRRWGERVARQYESIERSESHA